jgi:sulfur relay protein TusB/DsrH
MAALHLVNRPDALARCAAVVAPGDRVLCYESAVLACLGARFTGCRDALAGAEVLALRHDVDAHGLGGRFPPTVRVVDDDEFVELVVRSSPIVSWT